MITMRRGIEECQLHPRRTSQELLPFRSALLSGGRDGVVGSGESWETSAQYLCGKAWSELASI